MPHRRRLRKCFRRQNRGWTIPGSLLKSAPLPKLFGIAAKIQRTSEPVDI